MSTISSTLELRYKVLNYQKIFLQLIFFYFNNAIKFNTYGEDKITATAFATLQWRNIAQIRILYTKQTSNIYLGYFGILSFGKLGPVSLSLIYSPSNHFIRYTHIEEIDMREIDFYLAPQICAGTANTQSLQNHRTRPRQPCSVHQLQQNSQRSFLPIFSLFFLSISFQFLCVERRNKSLQSRKISSKSIRRT